MKAKLTESVLQSFKVAKVFTQYTDEITAIRFSPNGQYLISGSKDDRITVYDSFKGTKLHTVSTIKYGVGLIQFANSSSKAIHTSTKVDDKIRYLSLPDVKYLTYFGGHTMPVVTLCISPINSTFLSGSLDKSLRLWDLRLPNSTGFVPLTGRPVAAYDPEGIIFAAGVNSECVKLYDLRLFDKGPFATFKLSQEKAIDWSGLSFSPDGKTILISTNGLTTRLINAFDGIPLLALTGYSNTKSLPIEATFSPDSQFVFLGSRYRYQIVPVEPLLSGAGAVRAVQSQIHDDCLGLHHISVLAPHIRR